MNDQQFEKKLKSHLESWDEELPPAVAGKLRAARRDALASSRRTRSAWRIPAIAFASIACVALIAPRVLPLRGSAQLAPSPAIDGIATLSPDDLSLLTDGEELELLENVEFILWLAEIDDAELG